MKIRHFGRTLPLPSTLQILHDLLVFSAAEQEKRDRAADAAVVALPGEASAVIAPQARP